MNIFIAILSFLGGFFVSSLYGKKTLNKYAIEINDVLRNFLKGDIMEYSDLEETMQSQTISLLKQIDWKITTKSEENEKENGIVKELLADLSHQIRNPLNSISIYSELLETKKLSLQQRSVFVKKILSESAKIEWLSQRLLKSSRLETGAINFNFNSEFIKETIVRSIADVYQQLIQKNIEVKLIPFNDIRLYHNRKWTREAFVNILENAVKYSDPGTVITVSLERLETYSIIKIKDQGIGIPNSEKCQIFKRYYRGKHVQEIEGAGLGLYITRMILLNENGNISVKNNENKGCCFMIFLQNCKEND